MLSCNNDPVLIGGASIPGLAYSWKPSQGLSDPAISNHLANPGSATNYILTVNSSGGGCINHDTGFINKSFVDDSLQVIGNLNYCVGNGDSPVLQVQQADSIQWFRENIVINGANQTTYKPTQTGEYYAALFNKDGCHVLTVEAGPGWNKRIPIL